MGFFWEKVLLYRRKSTTHLVFKNSVHKMKPCLTIRESTIFRFARFGIFWEKVARYASRMRNRLCEPKSRGNNFQEWFFGFTPLCSQRKNAKKCKEFSQKFKNGHFWACPKTVRDPTFLHIFFHFFWDILGCYHLWCYFRIFSFYT